MFTLSTTKQYHLPDQQSKELFSDLIEYYNDPDNADHFSRAEIFPEEQLPKAAQQFWQNWFNTNIKGEEAETNGDPYSLDEFYRAVEANCNVFYSEEDYLAAMNEFDYYPFF